MNNKNLLQVIKDEIASLPQGELYVTPYIPGNQTPSEFERNMTKTFPGRDLSDP